VTAPTATVDRNGLEILDRDECLRLLANAHVGRLALSIDALPVILPVNFVVHEEQVVFRTAPGTKLSAGTRNSVVAFEADAIDPMRHEGWSVVVTGRAHEVVDVKRIGRLSLLPLRPWAPGTRDHFIAIDTDRITGRRLHTGVHI
jgi:nitroimidazol reductase NimA-like FMN-containing flavoprotein (pyridoxamine 5'-phosphate oxidase superfamily)